MKTKSSVLCESLSSLSILWHLSNSVYGFQEISNELQGFCSREQLPGMGQTQC